MATVEPEIYERVSSKLVGPIRMQDVNMYIFSEVILCEWRPGRTTSADGKTVGKLIFSPKDSDVPRIQRGEIQDVILSAWPCSIQHSEDVAGWAVDSWNIDKNLVVNLDIAVKGVGTRLDRIGYTWTAYGPDLEIVFDKKG